jgi:hypothetical protein
VNIIQKIRPGIRILVWDDVIRSDQFINDEKLVNGKNFISKIKSLSSS